MKPMSFLIFMIQALISAMAVLILRANLDGFQFRTMLSSSREAMSILLGIVLYGLSFLMWLLILSKVNVSFAYPITIGLTLAFVSLGANYFLKEQLTLQACLGITLIAIGVTLVGSKAL